VSDPSTVADALAAERWDEAMDALLAAWRAHRAPALAELVDALSQALGAGFEPIDPEAREWEREWETRASQRRAVELGVLLPHVTHSPKGGIPRRVRMALAFGPDPRTAAVLVDMIETPPTTASSNFSMWTELFRALPEYADSRARPRLEARAATRGGKSKFWPKLEGWIAAASPKLPDPARLPRGWGPQVAALAKQIAALAEQAARGGGPQLEASERSGGEWREVTELGPARDALAAGELAEALDLLVGFWGQCRSPVVAACIDRLGLLVDEAELVTPPAGPNKKAMHLAWMDAAEHPRPHAVGPLLATLREGKLADVEARIETIARWRPDPRVARAMVVLTKDYMLGARDRLWRAVYEALLHHADPRVADTVRRRHDQLAGARVLNRAQSEGRAVRRVFEPFVEAVEAEHELSIAEHEQAAQVERMLAERVAAKSSESSDDEAVERGLVEAIVAAWADDGPRQVYADWLQAREDPRGDFIALDLALAAGNKVQGKRDKWLETHRDALFGPLQGLSAWQSKFERGLLEHFDLTTRTGGLDVADDRRRELLDDLRWATIRSMRVSHSDMAAAEVFARAPLWALDELERPCLAVLASFAQREDTLPLRSLQISGSPNDDDAAWSRLGELTRVLPALERMAVMIWGGTNRATPPEAFFATELVRRLKVLSNGSKSTGGFIEMAEWITRMVATDCPVPLVHAIGPHYEARIHQRELGSFELELRLDPQRWDNRREPEAFAARLRALPRTRVRNVRLTEAVIAEPFIPEVEAALDGLDFEWVPAEPA
jgi:uncharacterized protein (TIGR02996 family)